MLAGRKQCKGEKIILHNNAWQSPMAWKIAWQSRKAGEIAWQSPKASKNLNNVKPIGKHCKKLHTSTHSPLLFPGRRAGRSMALVRSGLTGSWHQAQHHMTTLQVQRKSPTLWRRLVEVVVDEPDLLGHVVVLEIP